MTDPAPPPQSENHHQILQILRSALQPYGSGSAALELIWSDSYEGWTVVVTPTRTDAAPMEIGLDRWGGLLVRVADSSMDTDLMNCPFNKLATIAEHVFAGQIQEIGRRSDAFIRLGDGGSRISFGSAHLPIPWKLRRVRRFAPYA